MTESTLEKANEINSEIRRLRAKRKEYERAIETIEGNESVFIGGEWWVEIHDGFGQVVSLYVPKKRILAMIRLSLGCDNGEIDRLVCELGEL